MPLAGRGAAIFPRVIQHAEPQAEVLGEITNRICRAIRPWRVVLFGSRARGVASERSDYDIYVEVDGDPASLKQVRERLAELFRGMGCTLDFKVHPRGEIERRRDDPGTIEWDVAREGRLLHADPAAPRELAPPVRVREPSAEPPESVTEWLEAADRDLRHARFLRDAGQDFWPEICFLSHQTAEKHLKALLVTRLVRPERTHELMALLAALRDAGCVLEGIDADCALLTTHAITPRYPAGNALGEDDARVALAAAERVVAAVRSQLPRRVH